MGKKRKFRPYLKGLIEINKALGALATSALVSEKPVGTVTESTWLSSVRCTWSWKDITNTVSDGPIIVGVAHSDYTDQEIEEWLELAGSWDVGNLVTKEVRRRKIRLIGTFPSPIIDGTATVVLNDGKPITTKCGWMLHSSDNIDFWMYNAGSGELTTGSFVAITGHANLWPR